MEALGDLRRFPLLVVDDEEDNLTIFRLNFRNLFTVHTARSGEEALRVLGGENIAVLIADQRMPSMSGVELFRATQARWPHVIRILLTAYTDIDVVVRAVNEGQIFRYLSKPWGREELQRTIEQAIERFHMAREYSALVDRHKALLWQTVASLVTALEAKDAYTSGHSHRIMELAVAMADEMGVDSVQRDVVRLGSLLHDIGKIGVPLSILHKRDKLSIDELAVCRRHPEAGANILRNISGLEGVSLAVLHHHEYYDGRGYPSGLARDEIPLASRILSITDTYDAITSDRPYRKGSSHENAVAEIQRCRGMQFDPDAVEAFVRVFETGRINLGAWSEVLRRAS
ncbi:MAG: response regulator [Myxococcales bacterium]|nr:response regulator [Myxococcales bacterium]